MAVTDIERSISGREFDELTENAARASKLLKAIGSEARLLILCYLSSGEKSVSDLERLLRSRQSAVSQQLSRLRHEGLVEARREGKSIFYSIADSRVERVLETVHEIFCKSD